MTDEAMKVRTVGVDLGERAYPIQIAGGNLREVGESMAECFDARRAIVVTNPTVAELYLPTVEASLGQAGFEVSKVEVPDGEKFKSLETLSTILDVVLGLKPERSWPIVALGGGVVGDMAGFAAATVLRGVPYVQIPTTLLSQVDSSVGGKTGVNHAAGKNLIGAFYQPSLVLIDLETLDSLPRREFLAGLVEVIKYGVIVDAELFAFIEQNLDAILGLDREVMTRVVARCCEIKAEVVHRDEREGGLRAILNYGHTLGHAIENVAGYGEFLHGEAVAVGMAFASRLSEQLGSCSTADADRVCALLSRAGLDLALPASLRGEVLADAVSGDKKASGGRVKFVLMDGLGATRFESLTGSEIAAYAEELRGRLC